MASFEPQRDFQDQPPYSSKDVLVIFGEVFSRGYANGLIDQAQAAGMKVIYSTVGRRDGTAAELRPLNDDELAEKQQQPIINVPLEAGFDLEPSESGVSPCGQLSGIKMSQWPNAKLDWQQIKESQANGLSRFKKACQQWSVELEKHLNEDSNIIFAHIMAGGFPRAKVVMPAANRVFKGTGDRFTSSEMFWNSDIGKLCDISFTEVTGDTLLHLINSTSEIRKRQTAHGKKVSYVAYGYHGTEVLVDGNYQWQSYAPYLQGWAKLELENVAKQQFSEGVSVAVFNAPEILTNSSSIFLGVEVALYSLIGALLKEAGESAKGKEFIASLEALLSPPHSIEEILKLTNDYLTSETIVEWTQFDKWPQHNGPTQMELMRNSSANLISFHKDKNELITTRLSELVFKACGKTMFTEAWNIRKPVNWIGHDLVCQYFLNT